MSAGPKTYEDLYKRPGYDMKPWRQTVFTRWLDEVKPRSVLDLGCGRGETLTICKAKGIPCMGLDFIVPRHPLAFRVDIVKESIDHLHFDAVVALDFLEHLDPDEVVVVLEKMRGVAGRRLIGVPHWQDASNTHFTVKPRDWWLEKIPAGRPVYQDMVPAEKRPYTFIEV